MIVNLTQKERSLLEDQKTHEEICIKKYNNYANLSCDHELSTLFLNLGAQEKTHLDTINQLLSGQMPNMGSQGSGGGSSSGSRNSSSSSGSMSAQSGGGSGSTGSQQSQGGQASQGAGGQGGSMSQGSMGGQGSSMSQGSMGGQSSSMSQGNSGKPVSDKDLCTDILMTEKYVSGAYDTAIFEFRDPQIRNILNHIQKEEQQHGEAVFKYMESKGLYQVQ
jgi:spore coat protein CotF